MSNSPINLSKLGQNKTIILTLGVVLLFLLVICLVLWLPTLIDWLGGDSSGTNGNSNGNQTVLIDETPWQPPNCEELLTRAMEASFEGCQSIGSNQVCYGNFNVSAQLTDAASQFADLGDTVAVNQLLTLNTSPMDLDQNVWGIAVFKLQANMPGTVPGQNVTFLVFGDTGLYNYSGDMYSVYFSTGIGSVTCSHVPDGLKVDVPEGSGIVFTANGAEIALQGDSVLTANPGESMSVTMLNGTGSVTSDGQTQTLVAGEYLTVPLSENFESTGAPSLPMPLSDEVVLELCLISPADCEEDGPLSAFITITPTLAVVEDTLAPGAPTFTPSATSSSFNPNTNTPTWTFTPSRTPTITFTPSNTPTFTPTYTATNTPTATPTDTPETGSCSMISLGGYVLSGNTVSLTITNNNGVPIIIDRIALSWNESNNGLLDYILLETKTLWGGGQTNSGSPADIIITANVPHRTIDPSSSGILAFEFENGSVVQLSSLTIYFDIGCSKSK